MANSFISRRARNHGIRRQRGMSLIETAAVLSVASVAMGMFANTMADNAEQVKAKGVAEKMIEVQSAAKQFVLNNQAAWLNGGSSGPWTATGDDLRNQGFLPPNFVNRNGYNQSYSVIVRRVCVGTPTCTNKLEAMVTTHGGTPIPDRQLARIAGYVGASGGFVPSAGGATAYGASAGANIVGFQGGWNADSSAYSALIAPGSSVSTLGFSESGALRDYLYRNDSGGTEGNTMRTSIRMASGGNSNILMNGNDITQARRVAATDQITGGRIVAGSGGNYQPSVPAGIDVWAFNGIQAGGAVNAGTTVTAGTGITSTTGNIAATMGNVSAGSNVTAGADVTAGGDVRATGVVRGGTRVESGGSITAATDITATGNVIAGGEFRGSRFVDGSFYVDPDGVSRMSDVSADWLNANARIYGLGSLVKNTSAVRLADLLPRWVAQGGYSPSGTAPGSSNLVPVPPCGAGGTPRIVLNPMNDSYAMNVVVDATTGMAVTSVSYSNPNIYYTTAPFVNGVSSSGNRTTFARQYSASLSGGNWVVNLTGTPQNSGQPWQVHATTYCQYTF